MPKDFDIFQRAKKALRAVLASYIPDMDASEHAEWELSWSELQSQRKDCAAAMKSLRADLDKDVSDDDAVLITEAFDLLERQRHAAQIEMDERDKVGERGPRSFVPQGEDHGTRTRADRLASGQDTGWRDRQGNPVQVYASTQRMSDPDHYRDWSTRHAGFGETIRAHLTGPRNDRERRALAEGTGSSGGYTVPAPLAREFIDRLRAQSVAIGLGVRTVNMESETLTMAKLETDPAFSFRAEEGAVSETSPTFGAMTFTAKSAACIVKASRELLDDSVNVNEALMGAFSAAGALLVDRVIMNGSGTGNEPTGILQAAGINTVAAVGAPTNYDEVADAYFELETDDVPGPYGMVAHPRTWNSYRKLKDVDNNVLGMHPDISAIAKRSTTQLPTDLGGGSDESPGILGNWSYGFLGMRSELRIQTLQERYADTMQIGFLAWMRFDVQLSRPVAFCELPGYTTS